MTVPSLFTLTKASELVIEKYRYKEADRCKLVEKALLLYDVIHELPIDTFTEVTDTIMDFVRHDGT